MNQFMKANKKKIIKGIVIAGGMIVGAGGIWLLLKSKTNGEKILEIVEKIELPVEIIDTVSDVAEGAEGIITTVF